MKFGGILFILGGVSGFLKGKFLIGSLLLLIGVLLFRKSKRKNNNITNSDGPQADTRNSAKKKFIFRVAGTTKEGRQNTIKKIVKDWKENNPEDIYEGFKNKDIESEARDVYEVEIYDWCNIELVPEPDNKYDPNAIKIVSEFGMLGYVPATETAKVKEILKQDYYLSWTLLGGKYKYYDYDEEKVVTETLNYGIEITLSY